MVGGRRAVQGLWSTAKTREAERVRGTTVNSWGLLYAHKYEGMNIVSPLSQTEEKVFKHTLTTAAITK